jgi:PAS domain S-box-containing protein
MERIFHLPRGSLNVPQSSWNYNAHYKKALANSYLCCINIPSHPRCKHPFMSLVNMDLAMRSPFLAEGLILLILWAGTVLLFWSFRERYLVPWMGGWVLCGLGKAFGDFSLRPGHSQIWVALAYAASVAAAGLFTAGVLLYVHQKKLLLPAGLLFSFALVLAFVYGLWLPSNSLIHALFRYFSWRPAVLLAVVQLVRFAWGRSNLGRWGLALMLVFLHPDRPGPHALASFDVLGDLLFGLSMMVVVLYDSRVQIQRLDVLNSITAQSATPGEFAPTVRAMLKELVQITGAKAAWFRTLEEDRLVIFAEVGLSPAYAAGGRTLEIAKSVSAYALRESELCVLLASEAAPGYRDLLQTEGIHHLILVPVEGKTSGIGTLVMGMPRYRAHTENEKQFLRAAAKQIGLAAENHNLVNQVVQSRNEWARTFDSIPDYIFVHDPENRILRANQALLDRLQLSRLQVTGDLCDKVLPGAGSRWAGCPYCSNVEWAVGEDPCFGGYSVVSTSVFTGEGTSRGGTVHVIKDITEARAVEERYASLFNHMHEGVFTSTPDGRIVDCNDAFVRMLGYSREEILKMDVVESLYVDTEHREKFLSEMSRQGYVRNFEYLLRRKDGREINVIESSFATRDAAGVIDRYQGVVMDVTEMKRAEDEIRRRNRELYVLNNIAVAFNQSFDLDEILQLSMLQIVELLSTDTASVYLFEDESASLRKKASYGHRSAWVMETETIQLPMDFIELLKANHTEIIDHEQRERLPQVIQKFIQLEGLHSWLWVVLWRKEKMLGVLATSSRVPRKFSPSEEGVMIAVGRQLATTIEKVHLYNETKKAYEDLRRTQEQLLQSEKMSAVGQLISGVAHELNNPLTAVLGYAQLLESEHLEPRIHEFILKLRKQALRTQKIVQNLLSFGRQHKPSRVHVDLRSVVEDTIALRDYDLKVNNIVVHREFDAVLPSVVADPHQIEQVYLNIINNAADAMLDVGRGGALCVRLRGENGRVITEFHDSGPGFLDAKRAFDPFYTTKGVGKGTGLGLSICYGIVKEHGGEISAHNHTAGGAVIRVSLPVAVGEKPMTESERIVARRGSLLEGCILLVDDEEAVLDFEREVLAAAGLRVITATSGAAAIECLKEDEFDAIFLDSKVPGEWSSEDVYRWIEQQRPSLVSKTVLVLSNLSDPGVRSFVDATKVLCLVKPFEVGDLLAVARRMLRRARAVAHS